MKLRTNNEGNGWYCYYIPRCHGIYDIFYSLYGYQHLYQIHHNQELTMLVTKLCIFRMILLLYTKTLCYKWRTVIYFMAYKNLHQTFFIKHSQFLQNHQYTVISQMWWIVNIIFGQYLICGLITYLWSNNTPAVKDIWPIYIISTLSCSC